MPKSLVSAISRSFRLRANRLSAHPSADDLGLCLAAALRGRATLSTAEEWRLVRTLIRYRLRSGDPPEPVAVPSSRSLRLLVALMDAAAPGCLPFADNVLDPRCATGRVMAEIQLHTRAQVHGWECDPLWASLARHSSPDAHIAPSHLLTAPRPSGAQSLVIATCIPSVGNDLHRSRSLFEEARRVRFRRSAWTSSGTSELAATLTRVVRDLLRPGEVAGVLLPTTFLRARRFRSLREHLLRECERVAVAELPGEQGETDVGWTAIACVRAPELVFHERSSALLQFFSVERAGLVHRGDMGVILADQSTSSDGDALQRPPLQWVTPPVRERALAMMRERGFPSLGGLVTIQDGVHAGSGNARARVLRETPDGLQRPWPVASTTDIRPGVVEPTLRWLETCAAVLQAPSLKGVVSLRQPGMFERPRLYLAQRADTVAAALVASDGPWALSGVHVLSWKGPRSSIQSLSRLCGILNTPLMKGVMAELQGGRLDKRHRLSGEVLATLPIPWPLPRELHATAEMAGTGNADAMDELQLQLTVWLGTVREAHGLP